MNKTELIAVVAKESGLKKIEAEKAVNAVFAAIENSMKADEKVQLIGFGTFAAKVRPAREARNPKTGNIISVPESKAPVFKASKVLKDELNK